MKPLDGGEPLAHNPPVVPELRTTENVCRRSKRLSCQGAKTMMATAVHMAGQAGGAVVDGGGHIILLERLDSGRFHSLHSNTTKTVCAASGINYEMSVWAGLFAPKGTSPGVVARLADALDQALDDPAVSERLTQLGGSIPSKAERNPAAFDRFVRSEIARWAPILAATQPEK